MLPQRGVYPQRPTILDRTTAQYKGMLAGAPGEEEEIIIPQMQAVKTQPSTFTKISVYCLTLNGSKYHEGKVSPVRTVHRRFRLDKNWSEARLYSELALLFKEALERPD